MDFLRYRITRTTNYGRKDIPMMEYDEYPGGFVEHCFSIGEMVVVTKSHIIFFLYPSTVPDQIGFGGVGSGAEAIRDEIRRYTPGH